MANSSFMLGMVASIADKLTAMKQERDAVINGTGRGLVVLKASVVLCQEGARAPCCTRDEGGPFGAVL